MEEEVVLGEIYEKILRIERDLQEIKSILLGEEELSPEEEKELEEALEEAKKGDTVSEEELREILRED